MGLLSTPVSVGTKAVRGLLDMDTPSRMARATDQGYNTDVYHGSTHNLTNMDALKTNTDSDWGQGVYSSNNIDDVNANYAGIGPDLTSRIDRRMDDIDSRIDGYEFEDLINAFPEMTKKEAKSIASGNSEVFDTFKRRIATKEIAGPNSGVVYPLKLKTEDYAVIDKKNPTRIEGRDYQAEAADDLDRSDFGSDDDYEDALYELADDLRSNDYDSPLETISQTLGNAGVDDYAINDILQEFYDGDGISAFDLDRAIRSAEIYAEDELGNMIPNGAISAQVFRDLGYKGVKDNTVKAKFPTMEGMNRDTTHYITFPQNEQTIRSVNAKFDPDKSNSTSLLASNPVATAAGLGGLLAMTGSDDSEAGVVGKLTNSLFGMLDAGKKSGEVVTYPDEWIEQVPYELRKEVASHNEGILGTSYREGMEASPTYYHGTGAPDISVMRETRSGKAGQGGVYFTDSPDRASKYAELAGKLGRGDSPNVIPSKLNLTNPFVSTKGMPYNANIQSLKNAGHDGIILKGEMPDGGDEVIAFSPSQVRVPTAVFDPAKASSSNLLASNPIATTSAGLLANMTGQPSNLASYMQGNTDAYLTAQERAYLSNRQEFDDFFSDDTGYVRADVLPFRTNENTGDSEFATPQMIKGLLSSLYDLGQSPRSGIYNQQSILDLI